MQRMDYAVCDRTERDGRIGQGYGLKPIRETSACELIDVSCYLCESSRTQEVLIRWTISCAQVALSGQRSRRFEQTQSLPLTDHHNMYSRFMYDYCKNKSEALRVVPCVSKSILSRNLSLYYFRY